MMRLDQRTLVLWVGLGALLTACAAAPQGSFSYKLYPGPVRPAAELAVVRLGDADFATFSGRPVARADWSEVHLLPGSYRIEWEAGFAVSLTTEHGGAVSGSHAVDAELMAGHDYVLRSVRTTGYGYRSYFWIEDASNGVVVAGERAP